MQQIILILKQDERDTRLCYEAIPLLDQKGIPGEFAAGLRVEEERLELRRRFDVPASRGTIP